MKFTFDVYPSEFIAVFQAMIDEMKRHSEKKGNSWKDELYVSGFGGRSASDNIPLYSKTQKYLEKLFDEVLEDYKKTKRLDQLIDIMNVAGMIWCRGEILRQTR